MWWEQLHMSLSRASSRKRYLLSAVAGINTVETFPIIWLHWSPKKYTIAMLIWNSRTERSHIVLWRGLIDQTSSRCHSLIWSSSVVCSCGSMNVQPQNETDVNYHHDMKSTSSHDLSVPHLQVYMETQSCPVCFALVRFKDPSITLIISVQVLISSLKVSRW